MSTSKHYEIVEAEPYALVDETGLVLREGAWAGCRNEMLRVARDGDRVTPGPAQRYWPAEEYRRQHNERARLCRVPHLVIEATP